VRRKGQAYSLVKKSESAFMYEVIEDGGFDVFERRISPEGDRVFNGETVHREASESWPGDSAFGVLAWHFMTPEGAEKKFTEINYQKNYESGETDEGA